MLAQLRIIWKRISVISKTKRYQLHKKQCELQRKRYQVKNVTKLNIKIYTYKRNTFVEIII